MALILRETKGSPLTFSELDGNFIFLNQKNSFSYTDPYGYVYGISFEEYTSNNPIFTEPVNTTANYYKDESTGTYYEQFYLNANVPQFGGDGSSLVPYYWNEIVDNSVNANMLFTIGQGETDIANSDLVTEENCSLQISPTSINISYNDPSTQASITLNSTLTSQIGAYNFSTSKSSVIINEENTFDLYSLDNLSNIEVGIRSQESSVGKKYAELFADNNADTEKVWVRLFADTLDLTQKTRVNIGGLKTYADLAAAQTDGLVSGDLFIVGNVLNIVP